MRLTDFRVRELKGVQVVYAVKILNSKTVIGLSKIKKATRKCIYIEHSNVPFNWNGFQVSSSDVTAYIMPLTAEEADMLAKGWQKNKAIKKALENAVSAVESIRKCLITLKLNAETLETVATNLNAIKDELSRSKS